MLRELGKCAQSDILMQWLCMSRMEVAGLVCPPELPLPLVTVGDSSEWSS